MRIMMAPTSPGRCEMISVKYVPSIWHVWGMGSQDLARVGSVQVRSLRLPATKGREEPHRQAVGTALLHRCAMSSFQQG